LIQHAQRDGARGILSADRWLKTVLACRDGDGGCALAQLGTASLWATVLKAAAQELTYFDEPLKIKEFRGYTTVKNAIAEFDCVLTATTKDRDGDLLESKGAQVDPLMPLLWQHVPLQPIGKLVRVVSQDDDFVVVRCAIVDTQLGEDAAKLFDFGALRISHGFRPIKFTPIKREKGDTQEPGWHVLDYEVMEVSGVSVPSNTRAQLLDFSWEKLHHPLVKSWVKATWDLLPKTVSTTGLDVPGQKCAAGCACETCKPGDGKGKDDECVSAKIRKLMDEGKEQAQAVAIAINMCAENDKAFAPLAAALKSLQSPPAVKGNGPVRIGLPDFPGTFEDAIDDLEDGLEAWLGDHAGERPGRYDLHSVLGTYPKEAIVCVLARNGGYDDGYWPGGDNDYDADDGYTYYRLAWNGDLAAAAWTGTPEEVELEASAKQFLSTAKGRTFMETKMGRAVSKKNAALLTQASDNFGAVHDHDKTIADHKTMCKAGQAYIKDVVGEQDSSEGQADKPKPKPAGTQTQDADADDKAARVLSAENMAKVKAAYGLASDMASHEKMHALGKAAMRDGMACMKSVMESATPGGANPGVGTKPNPEIQDGGGPANPGVPGKALGAEQLTCGLIAALLKGDKVAPANLINLKDVVDDAWEANVRETMASVL